MLNKQGVQFANQTVRPFYICKIMIFTADFLLGTVISRISCGIAC